MASRAVAMVAVTMGVRAALRAVSRVVERVGMEAETAVGVPMAERVAGRGARACLAGSVGQRVAGAAGHWRHKAPPQVDLFAQRLC